MPTTLLWTATRKVSQELCFLKTKSWFLVRMWFNQIRSKRKTRQRWSFVRRIATLLTKMNKPHTNKIQMQIISVCIIHVKQIVYRIQSESDCNLYTAHETYPQNVPFSTSEHTYFQQSRQNACNFSQMQKLTKKRLDSLHSCMYRNVSRQQILPLRYSSWNISSLRCQKKNQFIKGLGLESERSCNWYQKIVLTNLDIC